MMWMGLGVAGPSVIAGCLLFMYKMALALFVGLGPLFILSLLFEQTKQFFSKWLFYGIGTMFSLAVLAFMVAVVLKILTAAVAAIALQAVFSGLNGTPLPGGMTSVAMQQGGLGLLMTVMLITVPPMAGSFFNGTLAAGFNSYTQFGVTGHGARDPSQMGPSRSGMPWMRPERTHDGDKRIGETGSGSFGQNYSYNNPATQISASTQGSGQGQGDVTKQKG